MIDRVGQVAEALATGISRRGFLGWAGKSALAVAGVLVLGAKASARPKGVICGQVICKPGRACCDPAFSICSHGGHGGCP